jgi:hypothetical protein
MADFIDGVIAGWCQRRAAILLWRRQRLLCMEANARYRVRLRAELRGDEEAPF